MKSDERDLLVTRLIKNSNRLKELLALDAPKEIVLAELENLRRITIQIEHLSK